MLKEQSRRKIIFRRPFVFSICASTKEFSVLDCNEGDGASGGICSLLAPTGSPKFISEKIHREIIDSSLLFTLKINL